MGIHIADIPPDILVKQMKVRIFHCRYPFSTSVNRPFTVLLGFRAYLPNQFNFHQSIHSLSVSPGVPNPEDSHRLQHNDCRFSSLWHVDSPHGVVELHPSGQVLG